MMTCLDQIKKWEFDCQHVSNDFITSFTWLTKTQMNEILVTMGTSYIVSLLMSIIAIAIVLHNH